MKQISFRQIKQELYSQALIYFGLLISVITNNIFIGFLTIHYLYR